MTRKQLLEALRTDHPELRDISDNKLFAAFAVDHPDIAKSAVGDTMAQQQANVKPAADSRSATEVMQDQAAAALQGMPKVVTGIPGAIKGLGGIALKTLSGHDLEALQDVGQMAKGAAQPFITAARGASAAMDPQMWSDHPIIQGGLLLKNALQPQFSTPEKAPTRQEWESAADFAGTNLIASELPNAARAPIVGQAGTALKNMGSAAVNKTVQAAGDLANRVAETVSPTPTPESSLFRAIKPYARKIDFEKNLKLSMPRINDVVDATSKPVTGLDDLIEHHIPEAKKAVWKEYEALTGGQPIDVDLTPVADAMEGSISKKMLLEDPDAAQAIRDRAANYRGKVVPQEDAEDLLRTTNAELEAYYNKYPTARRKALDKNPETALLDAQGKSLREQIYDAIDPTNGGAAAKQLKKTYGALMELEEEGFRRLNQSKRMQPESLAQQMAKIHAAGRVVGGAGGALAGLYAGEGPGAVIGALGGEIAGGYIEGKVANWLKARGETDSLIKSAFDRFKTRSTPTVGSTPQAIAAAQPPSRAAQLWVPQQRSLPPATGQTVLPSSGQTFQMPQNISLQNMADIEAYLKQQAGKGQMNVEAALAPQPGLLPGGIPLEAPSRLPRWGTGSISPEEALAARNRTVNAPAIPTPEPEVIPAGDAGSHGLGERWHGNWDLGSVEEDAGKFFLDSPEPEGATAGIQQSHGEYFVHFPDRESLGPFESLQQAAKAAEQAVPQLPVNKNVPLGQMNNPAQLPAPAPQTLKDLLDLHAEPDWVSLKKFAKPEAQLLKKLSGKLRSSTPTDAELTNAAEMKIQNWLDEDDAMLQRSKAELPAEDYERTNAYGKETAEDLGKENATANFRGGLKANSVLSDFEETPDQLRRAMQKGKGDLYDRIVDAFKAEATDEWQQWKSNALGQGKSVAAQAIKKANPANLLKSFKDGVAPAVEEAQPQSWRDLSPAEIERRRESQFYSRKKDPLIEQMERDERASARETEGSGQYSVEYGSRATGQKHREFDTLEEAKRFARKRAKQKSNDFTSLYHPDGSEIDYTK